MRSAPANRWQAFGLHLLISLMIFIALAALIYFWWYPGFLFRYDGGLEGIKLIAGVDFFIGPVLTLLVYQVGKKSLRFDLACIAVLQAACIAGGMWTVWQTRPVAVVYAAGYLKTVSTENFTRFAKQDADSVPILRDSRWPVWVSVPVNQEELKSFRHALDFIASGAHYRAADYVPFSNALPQLPFEGVTADSKLLGERVSRAAALVAEQPAIRFYPINTSMVVDAYAAINSQTGELVEVLP